jgi:ABC-2 type transport system permease protein
MKRTLALLRVALRSNFGLTLVRYRLLVEKRDRWMVPLILLGVAGFVPLVLTYVQFLKLMFNALQPAGQETTVLTLAILAGQLLVLIFGLYYVLSVFYFSRDLEFLVSLPVRPAEVMLSKFGVILVNEYLTTALIVIPAFVVFGLLGRRGPEYWVLALLVYLLLPVIPVALAGLLIVGMMRVVNVSRKKDFFILAGSLVLLAAALIAQFSLARTRDLSEVMGLFTARDGLVQVVGAKFPPCIWASRLLGEGLTVRGLGFLALFGGGSILLLLLLTAVAERLFYRGLIGLGERAAGRRRLSKADLGARISAGRRPVRAVFAREWRLMNRTPLFLLNGIMSVILVPVILLLALKAGDASGPLLALRSLGTMDVATEILIAAVFFTVCGTLNGTASSTYSREGRQFWLSKVIPVSPAKQTMGKFLHSYLVAVLGTVAGAAVSVVLFHFGPGRLVPAILLSLVGGVFFSALSMTVDLARPLLTWLNPQKAIKQNLNVLIALALEVGLLFVLGYLIKAARSAGLDGAGLIVAVFALMALLGAGALAFLLRFAEKRYPLIAA